jgi:hypothetical protein
MNSDSTRRRPVNDRPTSIQYGLGVAIGHLVIQARKDGASDDEVIATLRNTIRILEDHRAVLRAQSDRNPALTDAVVTTFIRAVWAARDKSIADHPRAQLTACVCPACQGTVDIRLLPQGRIRAVCRTLDCLSLLQ